jgi:hypothetical protein
LATTNYIEKKRNHIPGTEWVFHIVPNVFPHQYIQHVQGVMPYFRRMFLRLNYINITEKTYIQS